jgi:hypothetical protein
MKDLTQKHTKQVSGAGLIRDAVITVVAEKVVTATANVVVEKVKEVGKDAHAWDEKNKKDAAAFWALTSC